MKNSLFVMKSVIGFAPPVEKRRKSTFESGRVMNSCEKRKTGKDILRMVERRQNSTNMMEGQCNSMKNKN
jgi:hypothetical protein